jgi:hypothetical protein
VTGSARPVPSPPVSRRLNNNGRDDVISRGFAIRPYMPIPLRRLAAAVLLLALAGGVHAGTADAHRVTKAGAKTVAGKQARAKARALGLRYGGLSACRASGAHTWRCRASGSWRDAAATSVSRTSCVWPVYVNHARRARNGTITCHATPPSKPSPTPRAGDLDYAVIGDTPYGTAKLERFPADVAKINADPTVQRVLHLGDIKSSSSRCDTSYYETIRRLFDRFADPLVYTPGDNEWTDCHDRDNGGYQPAGPRVTGPPVLTPGPSRLDEVRRIFFDRPGRTLGGPAVVQAQQRPFVENVRWTAARTDFGTLNVPGANNDLVPWFGSAETPALRAARTNEFSRRDAANIAWLGGLFDHAERTHAKAVVVAIQADMWEPVSTGDRTQYSGYAGLVRALATRARHFGRPVLLLNGDSHVYESDRPLADPSAANSRAYGVTKPVPNLRRVTVDGSDEANDYLRLRIEPGSPAVFSWSRVRLG